MASDIEQAIRQITDEKGLSYESVIETVEIALAAAYRKDYGDRMQNIEIEFDTSTGGVNAFDSKEVVEDLTEEEMVIIEERQAEADAAREAAKAAREAGMKVERKEEEEKKEDEEGGDDEGPTFNPKTEIMLRDAMVLKMGSKVGDILRRELPLPGEFGRMAAMTAKQVITQKLREAEREIIFNEFKEQEGEVLIGTVQRREGRVVLVDLGRTTGIMLPEDQVSTEKYNSGDRVQVYVREVSLGTRGPQILLSRTSEELIKVLFELEIPEVSDGTVEIKRIAREAGARTKVAVFSADDSIDPIGACIGQRGIRIQTIINELSGEKIDVIEWNEDAKEFIIAALSPAKVQSVELNEEERVATAKVDNDQLSLAIGRGGQNVRLAAKLTGWKLSVAGDKVEEEEKESEEVKEKEAEEVKADADEVKEKEEEVDSETDVGVVSSTDPQVEESKDEASEEVVEEAEEAAEVEVNEDEAEAIQKPTE